MISELPPHSIEIEIAVIGSILQSTDALIKIIDILPTEAFFVPLHREIYQVATGLYSSGVTPDPYTIVSRFKEESEKYQQATDICYRTVFPDNVESYASVVLEKWKRRRVVELGQKAIALAYDPTSEWDSICSTLENGFTDIFLNNQTKSRTVHIQDALINVFNNLETRETEEAIATNIRQLDDMLNGGLKPKSLTVIAGRPAMGKSQVLNFLARQSAQKSIKEGTNLPVFIFSMEMDTDSEAIRFLSTESGVNLSRILSRRFKSSDMDDITSNLDSLLECQIYINDTPGDSLTLGYITSECQKIKRKHGGIGIVLVDYLQLFGDRASNQRSGEVGKYSAGLLNLAKQLDCPVVALAQLNRATEGRNDKRPQMADLGESGKVEQDAHTVILLYRPDYYEKEPTGEEEVTLEWIFAKNRNGPCGTVKTFFHLPTGRIRGERPSY